MVWWPINTYKSFFSWSWQSQFIDMDDGYVWNSGISRPWSWFFVMWVSGGCMSSAGMWCVPFCERCIGYMNGVDMIYVNAWCKDTRAILIIDVKPGPHGPGISNHHRWCGAEHRFWIFIKHRFGRCIMDRWFNQSCLFSILGQAIPECLAQTGFLFQLMHWPQWSNDHDAC